MRKLIASLAIAATVALPAFASAQVVASDASYTITRSTGAPFTSIAGTGTLLTANSDDQAFNVALASPFTFYGTTYNSFNASTNGLLSFGAANANFTNVDLAGVVGGSPVVAVYWDDLQFFSAGMYRQSVGNLTTIEWSNAQFFGFSNAAPITVQAILNSFTGEIVLNYFDVDTDVAGRSNGASATIGIQGPSSFAQVGFNTNSVASGDRLTIAPSTTVPEPSSLLLSGAGAAMLGLVTHLRRRKPAIVG